MAHPYTAGFDVYRAWPEGARAWYAASNAVYEGGLDKKLLNLVMIRASQINGCSFCLDMHAADAADLGEHPRRINTVAGWRDAPWFADDERVAFELTEAVTNVNHGPPDDSLMDKARACFGDEGAAQLLMAIVIINGWNRINVAAHVHPV